jgi:serine/threonine protein kinase
MSSERWQKLDRIFAEARELPPEERGGFVADACGTDERLRAEALGLLAADQASGEFMAKPALDSLAQAVASEGWRPKPGEHIGAYRILRQLGSGGSGEVWRARDERLGRDVAIKFLLPHFEGDVGRLGRFADEARAAGALNHPNILTVHDVGQHDGVPFIVSECLDGQSLRQRLQAGSLRVDEAASIALGIARGLAAAHARGIVHRDLKPENTFVLSNGGVKILDLGVAKLQVPLDDLQSGASHTTAGVIVGTAGYMSPEQVRGERVDARADLFALGVMLHEMLGGRNPFRRASTLETLHTVLTTDPPDLASANESVPPALASIAMRLLKKTPDARFQSALDLAWALEQVPEGPAPRAPLAGRPVASARRRRLLLGLSVIIALGVLATLASRPRPGANVMPRSQRSSLLPPGGVSFAPFDYALSPDGSRLAFVGIDADGRGSLWIRSLDSRAAQPLGDTRDCESPFWAPDGHRVGFFADGKLKVVDTRSGVIQILADAQTGRGGGWSRDGTIVFPSSLVSGPLLKISERGGAARPATEVPLEAGGVHRTRRTGRRQMGSTSGPSTAGRPNWFRPTSLEAWRTPPGISSTCRTAASWPSRSIPRVSN